MNRSIIQTAIANRDLPLELCYRERPGSGDQSGFDDLAEVKFAPRVADQLADEFACLLRVI